MIVLTRKVSQNKSSFEGEENTIYIGDNIQVVLLQVKGNQVRIGIKAPKEVKIDRKELRDANVSVD